MKKSLNNPLGSSSVELLNSIKKKNAIVEKLTKLFSNKLQYLMKEKNFSLLNLQKEISEFFETYSKLNINEYDFIIRRLENHLIDIINNNENNSKIKSILDKTTPKLNKEINNRSLNNIYNHLNVIKKDDLILNKKSDIGNSNDPSNINNYNKILDNIYYDHLNSSSENIKNKDIDKNLTLKIPDSMPIINHQRSFSTNKQLPINFYVNEKLSNLRDKKNDEWSLIAKFNHLKQLEDDKQKMHNKEEKQKKFKEILNCQLMEKDMLKKIKQEEDWQFFLNQNDKMQNIQNQELMKIREKQDKLKAEKEMQDKLVIGKFFI